MSFGAAARSRPSRRRCQRSTARARRAAKPATRSESDRGRCSDDPTRSSIVATLVSAHARIELAHDLPHRRNERRGVGVGRSRSETRARDWRRHRRVNRALVGLVEPGVFHIADDAHDRCPRACGAAALFESFADSAGRSERSESPRRDRQRRLPDCPRRPSRASRSRPCCSVRPKQPQVFRRHRDPRRDRLRLSGRSDALRDRSC